MASEMTLASVYKQLTRGVAGSQITDVFQLMRLRAAGFIRQGLTTKDFVRDSRIVTETHYVIGRLLRVRIPLDDEARLREYWDKWQQLAKTLDISLTQFLFDIRGELREYFKPDQTDEGSEASSGRVIRPDHWKKK